MTPLHLLPPLLMMPLTSAQLTSLIASPAASRTMTRQVPAPSWPMAFICQMGSLRQTVMASDVNMSDGRQLQMDALGRIIALVLASQTSKLMTVSGTLACCCIPSCRFCNACSSHVAKWSVKFRTSFVCLCLSPSYRLINLWVRYWLYVALQGGFAKS